MKHIARLEERITEAVDGKLNNSEILLLQDELKAYPDLQKALTEQLQGLPIASAYQDVLPDPFAISRLRNKIKTVPNHDWQFEIFFVFKRYVLATGIASLLLVSVLHMIPQDTNSDSEGDEISIMLESIESEALDWAPTTNGQQP